MWFLCIVYSVRCRTVYARACVSVLLFVCLFVYLLAYLCKCMCLLVRACAHSLSYCVSLFLYNRSTHTRARKRTIGWFKLSDHWNSHNFVLITRLDFNVSMCVCFFFFIHSVRLPLLLLFLHSYCLV